MFCTLRTVFEGTDGTLPGHGSGGEPIAGQPAGGLTLRGRRVTMPFDAVAKPSYGTIDNHWFGKTFPIIA